MFPEFDVIQRFLFDKTAVRGEIVRLKNSYQTIISQQNYPAAIQHWLGQALSASVLLSATIKYEGLLILQVQTEGPLKVLLAHSTNDFHIRGLAQWEQEKTMPESFAKAAGKGHLAITIQPKTGQRYQGVVGLAETDLAAAVAKYFHQSEQLATYLLLAADDNAAGGLLLQNMPAPTDTVYDNFWEHAVKLAQTLTADELLNLPNQTILHRLYHEEDIVLFDAEPVSFRCTCSQLKSEQVLQTMTYEEVKELLQVHKNIVVTCEFCNHPYAFDAIDIARVFTPGAQGYNAVSEKPL